jgi:hypothetical protein
VNDLAPADLLRFQTYDTVPIMVPITAITHRDGNRSEILKRA